jgi:hypothetical protein
MLRDLPPCAKCKREHRECVFDTQRKKAKHRNPPRWARDEILQRARHDSTPGITGGATGSERTSANDPESLTTPSEQAKGMLSPPQATRPQYPEVSPSGSLPSISQRLLSTVVAGSADALETLSHAAHNTDMLPEQARTQNHNDSIRATRSLNGMGLSMSSLSEADDAVLDIWDKCRFVRQGWFTAQEAVTFIDLYDTVLGLRHEDQPLTLFSAVSSYTSHPYRPLISVNFEDTLITRHWYVMSHYYVALCSSYPRESSYCQEQAL